VDLLWPLGTGYPLPRQDQRPIIIAGGIGIASVFSLAESIEHQAHLVYGARIGDDIFMAEEMRAWQHELVICTDDGSCGRQGTVVDVLNEFLCDAAFPDKKPVVYACGPIPMLKEIARIALANRIHAYLSLEEHMACGIGACLGCVVKTRDGYKRVCKEGPVFDAAEIIW
jgi:dihydroorotate dehydrogenase electron transfer subunit